MKTENTMLNMKRITFAVSAMLVLAAFAGCKQSGAEGADTMPMVVTAAPDAEQPQADVELVPVLRKAQPTAKPAAAARPATQKRAAAPARNDGKAETIYVETEGAQGRVWGHVTMQGDRGTGTIHDWDENTLAVSVTRHGNELFAVDQNSRLYVFKLKQNKTQQ